MNFSVFRETFRNRLAGAYQKVFETVIIPVENIALSYCIPNHLSKLPKSLLFFGCFIIKWFLGARIPASPKEIEEFFPHPLTIWVWYRIVTLIVRATGTFCR